jgi:hypothetical protein
MFMKKKSVSMKYVDAMAIKDGYIAKPVSKEELCATNARYGAKPGPYEMEYMGKEEEDEEEMD